MSQNQEDGPFGTPLDLESALNPLAPEFARPSQGIPNRKRVDTTHRGRLIVLQDERLNYSHRDFQHYSSGSTLSLSGLELLGQDGSSLEHLIRYSDDHTYEKIHARFGNQSSTSFLPAQSHSNHATSGGLSKRDISYFGDSRWDPGSTAYRPGWNERWGNNRVAMRSDILRANQATRDAMLQRSRPQVPGDLESCRARLEREHACRISAHRDAEEKAKGFEDDDIFIPNILQGPEDS